MPPTPPRRPIRPAAAGAPTQYHTKDPAEANAGELFRVRDKDWETVWAENLSYEEAHRLKETVVGQGKSRTARLENMKNPPPAWYTDQLAQIQAEAGGASGNDDPQLAAMRAPALAAAKQAAAAAADRHAKHAARDRSAPAGAKRVSAPAPLPKIPVVSSIPAEEEEEDFAVDPDLVGGLGAQLAEGARDQPSAEDLKRARAKAAADAQAAAASKPKVPARTPEVVARAQALYLEACALRGGGVPWKDLHPKAQEGWLVDAVKPRPDPEPPATVHEQIAQIPDVEGGAAVDDKPTTVDGAPS